MYLSNLRPLLNIKYNLDDRYMFSKTKKNATFVDINLIFTNWGCRHNLGPKYILEGQLIMFKSKEIKHSLKNIKTI